jgi:Galactose oxidase, central domain
MGIWALEPVRPKKRLKKAALRKPSPVSRGPFEIEPNCGNQESEGSGALKELQIAMKSLIRPLFYSTLVIAATLLAGCRIGGASSGSGGGLGGGGGANGPYTISGTVTGLTTGSTGFVLQDNAKDNLTVTANGSFTFATAIVSGKPYNVSIFTPPTSPVQTCTVASGAGTALANVSNVQITCSTGTASIGGNVVGLLGVGLVLLNNGGDALPIATSNPFTFKTAIPIGTAYNVTISSQPRTPTQTCTVTSGSGTAAGNVGNIQITCSTGTLSVGGTVSGLAQGGTGVVLQNNGGDNISVTANGTFTMPTLVTSGSTYNITIFAQPTAPNQACTVTSGTGTAIANVTNIQIKCPAIFYTIGGTAVGIVGTTGGMVIQNNLGDNLTVPGNGQFTFNTPIADASTYDVSLLVHPSTQPAVGVVIWQYQGIATAAVTSVIVDGGHNDWSWMDGDSTANSKGAFGTPPPAPPTYDRDTPGGRKYPATWTDLSGNLWLFGGEGYTYPPGVTPPYTILDDMWVYSGTQNYGGSFNNYWVNTVPPLSGTGPFARTGAVTWTLPSTGDLYLFGGQDGASAFLNDIWVYHIATTPPTSPWTHLSGGFNKTGVYGIQGTPAAGNVIGSRWGATGRLDASGNVWVMGGYGYDSTGAIGLLNDLWKYNTATSQWTWVSGSKTLGQAGNYGTKTVGAATNVPGARETAMCWFDKSGNFWLFGGYTTDSLGNPAALNDLWEYTGGQWIWQSGANVVDQAGTYGTQGVAAATNVPGGRWSSAAWTDAIGNLWLFGGQGYDSSGNGSLGDLWVYTSGGWIWVKGPSSVSQPGNYGLPPNYIIYPYVVNYPGTRIAPGYWLDLNNELWIFGGEGEDATGGNGTGLLDDLWRYVPYPNYPSTN